MKRILLLSLGLVLLNLSKAQNPYESLGIKDVKVLTLSNGKYNEFFNNDTLVRIGSVMLNTKTNKVVSFVDKDSIEQTTGFEPQLVSRWVSPDPMAEKIHEWSPYNFVRNNPVLRIDPDGLTDYTFNKKTGEVTQVGDANDDPDRILRTNNKGEIKYKKNGEAKVSIDGIEQGILSDGQNFKTDDQVISVGGENQPSLAGVEDFVTKLAEHIGVEIAGMYLSNEEGANANISTVYIDEYKGNESQRSSISPTKLYTDASLKGMNTTTHFHTHPSNIGISRTDVERPSGTTGTGGDLDFRDNNRSNFHNFLILTRTATYPTEVLRIPYTNWKR